ncbi:hypothetical protein H4Q26_009761, partial [Puccinia striiformis f. sp. tritici PST-130]
AFLDQHLCRTICDQLQLGYGGKAADMEWKKPNTVQSRYLDKIQASGIQEPAGDHNFGGRSNDFHNRDSLEFISP